MVLYFTINFYDTRVAIYISQSRIKKQRKKHLVFPPPNLEQLQEFKQGLLKIAENVQYTKHINPLQDKWRKIYKNIRSSDKVFFGADKTKKNFYKIKPEEYEKFLKYKITKE